MKKRNIVLVILGIIGFFFFRIIALCVLELFSNEARRAFGLEHRSHHHFGLGRGRGGDDDE